MTTVANGLNEEYSVIKDKGEIGFIDFGDDKSVCSYNPSEEGPIMISVPFPFNHGKPKSAFVGEMESDVITLCNTTSEPIDLWSVKIYASNPENSFTLSLMEPPSTNSDIETLTEFFECFSLEDRVLQPRKTLTIWLSCMPKEIGVYTTVVHFDVGNDRIERVVFLLAEDKVSHSLVSSKPYCKGMRKKQQVPVNGFVPGSRPARRSTRVLKYRLPPYPIPKHIRDVVENKQTPDSIKQGLCKSNYASFFRTLMVMEEISLEEDMRSYDMECVSMKSGGSPYLMLEVPGLAERRPSLVHGDFIFARLTSANTDDTSSPYQGFIHRVEADQIFLKFDPEFHTCHRDGNLYNVQFTYNRLNMRRLYQSVEAAERLDRNFLFPSEAHGRRQMRPDRLSPISAILNDEQICSVQMILSCKSAPPYVIHGPPGTGKTMTIVEAILQVYKARRNARILICAPSNSAADHVMEKLLSQKSIVIGENDLLRLNATSRPYSEVNPEHLQFCSFNDEIFTSPPLEDLVRYRIVISTYMSAAILYAEGVERGHFSHIFLDEAGQASEPETMVPISHLSRRETVLVLAGDPLQLGPVVYSRDAENLGMGKSYLERLFECDCYCYGDENYVTKLVRNYRCHPEILHLPSVLFYKGELIACKKNNDVSEAYISLLPRSDFPVLFVGIQGCDEREGSNPSWFNRIEASKVVDMIKRLTQSGKLRGGDIGVITPYRQQVLKIKKALGGLDIPDIKVGSVEQFQGQEREVVIVSTVRSTIKHNEFDRVHCLGFLSNPRRFNVAVTRAKSLLVIIGNPHIISEDTYWNKLLWHCCDNGSYQGCGRPERQEVVKQGGGDEGGQWGEEDGWGEEGGQLAQGEQVLDPTVAAEKDEWSCDPGAENTGFSANPTTDEAEWSDGWKD